MLQLNQNIPAILGELGPIPTQGYNSDGSLIYSDIEKALQEWIDTPDSNLMIISGAYGSGKSHAIHEYIGSGPEDAVYDFGLHGIPGSENVAVGSILFIDHFDGFMGHEGLVGRPPDIRDVSHLLRRAKVCLVTNRDVENRSQEIFRQSRFVSRQKALGIKDVHLISTRPWTSDDVLNCLENNEQGLAPHFTNIKNGLSADDLEEMMRPLVLSMLLEVLSKHPPDWIPEYGEIYDDFLEHALSWDYDHNRSKLSASEKRVLLSDVAMSILIGPIGQITVGARSFSITAEEIGSKIDDRPNVFGTSSELLEDFLRTNRCLKEVEANADDTTRHFKFFSKTIFEYFLALAISYRLQSGRLFGDHYKKIDPNLLDTRFLYFARRFMPDELTEPAQALLEGPEAEHFDRMILLYLLEDRPGFIQWLSMAPEDYFSYLQGLLGIPDGHFITKIAMFQLVSCGRMSASEYIDFVQREEEPFHLDIELQICRTPRGNLGYLEVRFNNPDLAESAAISIYRIAQLNYERAQILVEEAAHLDETQMLECKDALKSAEASNERRRSGERELN